jgi:hypothetical protein
MALLSQQQRGAVITPVKQFVFGHFQLSARETVPSFFVVQQVKKCLEHPTQERDTTSAANAADTSAAAPS